MDLALTDDQTTILDAVDSLSKPYATMPTDAHGFTLTSATLDRELTEGGFLDIAFDPDLGAITGALLVERLARLPYASNAAAMALIRPLLGEVEGPICLVDERRPTHPVRFLAAGATVVMLHADKVTRFTATEADVIHVDESLVAYPVALLNTAGDFAARAEPVDVLPADLRTRWRLMLAIELAGLTAAAIQSTVTYVSERKQFGRPLAAFQALRHRLASAHVLASGMRMLALKAAFSGDAAEAALAAAHAQDSATQIVYDLHQFLGAMGVTLEHPLHLWTYRMKALLSDLGGAFVAGADAADLIWARQLPRLPTRR